MDYDCDDPPLTVEPFPKPSITQYAKPLVFFHTAKKLIYILLPDKKSSSFKGNNQSWIEIVEHWRHALSNGAFCGTPKLIWNKLVVVITVIKI